MTSPLRILLLEDNAHDAELIQELLEVDHFVCEVTRVQTRAEFVAGLENAGINLILADYKLPSFDGLSALKLALDARADLPFIFVSGSLGEEVAIEAVKIGATDYVVKSRLSRLVPSVQRALREARERDERKKAEEAFRRSEMYLAEAQRLGHTGSFGWDPASGGIYWSEETFRIFGYDKAHSATIDMVLQRVHPDDLALVQRIIDRATSTGRDFDFEHRLLMPDGSARSVHVVAHAVRDQADRLEFVGAVMDVTAAKQAEEALHKAQADLAHVTRVTTLGELTASIAHEVNQPLAAVANNAEACLRWLDRESPNLDEARSAAEWIINDVKRASEVIHGLRELAKKSGPQLTKLDIDDVTKEVLALSRGEFHRHGVALRADLSASERPVLGDRVQLQQVLLNLTMNGIEAMRANGEHPRELTVSSTLTDADSVLVAVEDTGDGLDSAVAQRIFEPFFTTKSDGLGMGLSICRSIIEAHGGRLWASPRSPRGAVFQFTVPTVAKSEV